MGRFQVFTDVIHFFLSCYVHLLALISDTIHCKNGRDMLTSLQITQRANFR